MPCACSREPLLISRGCLTAAGQNEYFPGVGRESDTANHRGHMMNITQDENEAIVRLLLAGRIQDRIVSIAEGDEFLKQVTSLPWASESELSFFVVTEAARIRKTLATHREDFITAQCALVRSEDARAALISMLSKVLEADGLDPKENTFITAVRQALPH